MAEALESMGDAFIGLDKDWRITLVNASLERLSRKASSELLGRVLWDVWPRAREPGTNYWTEYHRCMEERVPVRFVEHDALQDIWMEVRAYPTRSGGLSLFFRDVSEQKRGVEFEQQLIGIVSHDLRNPLQAIRLSATHGLKTGGLEPRQRRSFERILNSSDRALRMINDLLDFTRVRLGGGITVERGQAVDLHPLVAQVVDEVLVARPGRHVTMERSGDGRGSWDADRLSQVVQNLVLNALQHTTEDVPVRVRTWGEGEEVVLEVHNGGSPIPAEDLPRLFQPFQRGRNARPDGGRSMGLGLHITYHLVQAHGGGIRVRSSADEGTTFTVRLPRDG
ncbi:PAS domain-containing sensor histidine kinase [Archangium violaceum]|uniref:sensor histidine kinase n=1 Tax=Archangium violaceum TaxID=83451 RepID=UPI00194FCEE4|nr:PAS domain-containing sensor histidine kinase [Archangium violaceum]QRO02163.1 PAS domain-containing sensor histidine kinase [Archangium violaceum]